MTKMDISTISCNYLAKHSEPSVRAVRSQVNQRVSFIEAHCESTTGGRRKEEGRRGRRARGKVESPPIYGPEPPEF